MRSLAFGSLSQGKQQVSPASPLPRRRRTPRQPAGAAAAMSVAAAGNPATDREGV